ncbi:MAG: PAS domain S-box protein [Syntrophobacteraceae bacterium]
MNRKRIVVRGTRGQVCLAVLTATILGAMISFAGFTWKIPHPLGFAATLQEALLPALFSALFSAVFLALIAAGFHPIALSGQKRKKNSAEEQINLLQTIINTIPCPIFYKDAEGLYLGCNPAFEHFMGLSEHAITGKTVYDIAPGELADIYHKADLELLNAPGVQQYETSVLHADGSLHDVLFTKAAFSDLSGKTAGMVGVMLDITERKRTQRIAERNEATLRQIIDLVPHMIFVKDREGKFLLANRAVAARYSTTVEAITGKNQADVHENKEQLERILQNDRTVMESGKTLFIPEESYVDANGELHYLQATKVPFHTNGENVEAVLGIAIDITERKRIENALRQSEEMLRESEALYRSVVENIEDVFYRTDKDGFITMASPSAFRYYGAPLEQLIGKHIGDFWVYPEERAQMLQQMARDGVVRDYEVSIRKWDGSPAFVSVTSSLRKDRQGNILGIEGIIRDITQRKKADEEHALLVRAIEQVDEAIIITDPNWKIQFANPAFERLTGYSREEAVGMHTRDLKSDKHDKGFYRKVRDTLLRGDTWTGRITNRKKNGATYDAVGTASAIRDSSGAISNYISIHRDITRELQLENQLRQSQKMEALGTLAGGIAHDFNNILGIIMGYTQLAMNDSGSPPPAFTTRLEKVLQATYRAKELVQQILAFSRRTEQQKIPLQPGTIVKEAMLILRPSLPSTIEIKTEVASNAAILADPTQMHQVLMNLCTNAAHAMEEKGGVLEVALADIQLTAEHSLSHKGLQPGRYVQLTVRDSGQGIDPSIMESIFDPFFTTKEPGKGTGLGLSVVHGVVKSHGGAIRVESEPGKGSTFSVLFPVMQNDCVPVQEAESIAPACGLERVLVVDDEPVLAEMVQQMLTELGYAAVSKTSALQALDAIRNQPAQKPFDLVITDMTMPRVTGVELARELSSLHPEIPIILMTGYSEKIDAEKAVKMGISSFLQKPVSLNKMAKTIREVLDQRKAS